MPKLRDPETGDMIHMPYGNEGSATPGMPNGQGQQISIEELMMLLQQLLGEDEQGGMPPEDEGMF